MHKFPLPLMILGFMALFLTACAHGLINPPLAVDPAKAAAVTVIRPGHFVGVAAGYVVAVDGRDLFGLRSGEHVTFPVAPGEHLVAVIHPAWTASAAISAEPGERYYLEMRYSFLGDSRGLYSVSEPLALEIMKDTTPLATEGH